MFNHNEFEIFLTGPKTSRILVLEDDKSQSDFIKDVIHEINPQIQVDVEEDIARAMRKIHTSYYELKENAYDLLICDMYLKNDVSGAEVINHCRYLYPLLISILVSAQPKLHSHKKSYDYFLAKPVHLKTFHGILDTVFHKI